MANTGKVIVEVQPTISQDTAETCMELVNANKGMITLLMGNTEPAPFA